MQPVLVYFISGEFSEDNVIDMEKKLDQMYPDRDTDVFHVVDEEHKYRMLSTYNIEEVNSYTGDKLWESIEDDF